MTRIRSASEADIPGIRTLLIQLSAWLGETYSPCAAFIERYLHFPQSGCIVAEANGMVGLVAYSVWPLLLYGGNHGTVEALIVSEHERGNGVGTLLLAAVEQVFAEQDCVSASIATTPFNARAIRFYRERGYDHDFVLLEKRNLVSRG